MRIVAIGVLATGVMDIWSVLQRRAGLPTLDYALVGRWLAHMPQQRWRHSPIQRSAVMPHERLLGWAAHYALGIFFAMSFLALVGDGWLQHPSVGPPLVFGIATVVVPWCVIQPAFGAGIAASRTPTPWRARAQSVVTHAVFGLGLFIGAWLMA
ncbi:MAG: DUF2938 domain-containing protein [Stenotrophomonas sp.]|uniref:DUF2938 domain-containing protein n=1 Tax=Stenotrophomonas sp. TaxID=69392 RepID=UPI003D6D0883